MTEEKYAAKAIGCIPVDLAEATPGMKLEITDQYVKATCDGDPCDREIWVGPRGQLMHTFSGSPRLCPQCVVKLSKEMDTQFDIIHLGGGPGVEGKTINAWGQR